MELIHKKNGIVYITFNRPEAHNAIDPEMAVQLADTWVDFKEDKSLLCAFITGAGDRAFCAGMDLKKTMSLITAAREPEREHMKKFTLRDFDIYQPIIAAVNGLVFAAGFELLLNTDIRVALRRCPGRPQGIYRKARAAIHGKIII